MGFLALVPAKVWEILAVVVAIGAFGGYMYYRGGVGPRAETATVKAQFAAFQGQVRALGLEAQKAADARKAKDIADKEQSNHDFQTVVAGLNNSWSAEYDRLRKQSAGRSGSRAASPVAIAAGLSSGATAANQLSSAVSGYIDAARAAFDDCRAASDDFRASVARSLEQADRNTQALTCGVNWAATISK